MVNDQDWGKVVDWIREHSSTTAIMATDHILEQFNDLPKKYSLGNDVQSASKNFFSGIRHLDNDLHVKLILVQKFPKVGLGEAYMNRLEKASCGQNWSLK